MQIKPILRRANRLALITPISVVASTSLAFAEFRIEEPGIEKGEVEIEYRGAYHWGVPAVTADNQNANDLIQSHEIELHMGINDWWLIAVGGDFEQPIDENLHASAVEIDTKFALIKRMGDGIAVSFQLRYEQTLNHGVQEEGEPNVFEFGPIIELAKGPLLLTFNPLFTKQIGTFADQEGLGFDYGWRAEYDLSRRCGHRGRDVWRDRGFGKRRVIQ